MREPIPTATPRVVEAVGTAAPARGVTGKAIEAAMSQAVLDCAAADPPITDPVEVRKAMMAAREKVKAEAAQEPAVQP